MVATGQWSGQSARSKLDLDILSGKETAAVAVAGTDKTSVIGSFGNTRLAPTAQPLGKFRPFRLYRDQLDLDKNLSQSLTKVNQSAWVVKVNC
ncbi:hypothetical protein WJX84_010416 [Apatococcus fuscideae]|uniref:Uncharacterized protein n=1 Tax=Apatococcus fuscideae TaxID=2026836 RepID=A0AAW1TBD9_9CHLO